MTANEFNSECQQRFIDPALAVENDDIREALQNRDDDEVRRILDEEF